MKALDAVLVALLAVGAAEAGALAWRTTTTPVATLPLLLPGDDPGALFAPGGAETVLAARAATIGDYVTVEDLARAALLASRGELGEPLTAGERERLAALVARTDADREALLAVEAELRAEEEALDAEARTIVGTLTAEQRRWILDHRDAISVGRVEAEYWAELAAALAEPAP